MSRLVRARAAAAILTMVAAIVPAGAGGSGPFEVNLDTATIERAIALGRSTDAASKRTFHDSYVIPVDDQVLDRVEILTEFRRVVLETENRVGAADIGWGAQQAAAMLRPWRNTVSVVLHVTFAPNNSYRAMPPFRVVLYARPRGGEPARIQPLNVVQTPRYVAGQPAPPGTPILGGTVEATFSANTLDPRGTYLAGVSMDDRELRRVEIDFGRVQ